AARLALAFGEPGEIAGYFRQRLAIDAGDEAQAASARVDVFGGRQRGAIGERLGRRIAIAEACCDGDLVDLGGEARLAMRVQLHVEGSGSLNDRGKQRLSARRSEEPGRGLAGSEVA